MKDKECEAYIHTYKCDAKSCSGCQYRYKSLATGTPQTGKSRDIGAEIKAYTDKAGDESSMQLALDALEKQKKIESLLRCHDDFSVKTTQVNYELVKAVRKILEID